jgi:hypothetical protein
MKCLLRKPFLGLVYIADNVKRGIQNEAGERTGRSQD